MDNQVAIEFLKNMIDREAIGFVCPEREGDVAIWQYHVEALQMAISVLQALDGTDIDVGGTVSRQAAIDALMDEFKRVPTTAIRAKNRIDRLPSAQPNLQPTCNQLATDTISKRAAIDAIVNTVSEIGLHDNSEVARYGAIFRQHEIIDIIEGMPSAQPNDWMERNKERILQAGMEGREIEFRIGGRLFAIMEKAQ